MESKVISQVVHNIELLLDSWDMNVEGLATKTGLSTSGLYKLLQGNSFRIDALIKIAEAFYIPSFILFTEIISIISDTSGELEIITVQYDTGKEKSVFVTPYKNKKEVEVRISSQDEDEILTQSKERLKLQQTIDGLHKQIDFFKEQIEFYKEKAAEYKVINQQLMTMSMDQVHKDMGLDKKKGGGEEPED